MVNAIQLQYTRYEKRCQSQQKMKNINVVPTIIASPILRKSDVCAGQCLFFITNKSSMHNVFTRPLLLVASEAVELSLIFRLFYTNQLSNI